MENKTDVTAPEHTQNLLITRQFNLPVELLFKAFVDATIFEQWMTTKVMHYEAKTHGAYAFETAHNGVVMFRAHGTFHEVIPNETIIRTFEMQDTGFPVQLEFLHFEAIDTQSSKLTMHILFKSAEARAQLLALPFAQGLQMAHDRLQHFLNI